MGSPADARMNLVGSLDTAMFEVGQLATYRDGCRFATCPGNRLLPNGVVAAQS